MVQSEKESLQLANLMAIDFSFSVRLFLQWNSGSDKSLRGDDEPHPNNSIR